MRVLQAYLCYGETFCYIAGAEKGEEPDEAGLDGGLPLRQESLVLLLLGLARRWGRGRSHPRLQGGRRGDQGVFTSGRMVVGDRCHVCGWLS